MRRRLETAWYRLVESGFGLLYNEFAWTYDFVSWIVSLGDWRAWQKAALPYLKGPRVLEIAHGPGHMLLAMAEQGLDAIGIDLSPAMGRQAKARLCKAGHSMGLLRSRAQELPLPRNSFDSVLSTFPTAFIVHAATINAIWRILKPGGRLLIVPAAHLTGQDQLASFIEWLYVITGQRQGGPSKIVGAKEFGPMSPFVKPLEAAGFRVSFITAHFKRSESFLIMADKDDV